MSLTILLSPVLSYCFIFLASMCLIPAMSSCPRRQSKTNAWSQDHCCVLPEQLFTHSSWTTVWCPCLLTATWELEPLCCKIMLPFALFSPLFKLSLTYFTIWCRFMKRDGVSLLPRSRLRQPGVWGPAHTHKSETPVTSDRPEIKVSPILALKRSRAPRKKRLMQTEAGSFYKGMIQVLATWRCI